MSESYSVDRFLLSMTNDGYCVIPGLLNAELASVVKHSCESWVKKCSQFQIDAGLSISGDSTAHHAVGANDGIDRLIHSHLLHPYISAFFNQKPYILHACNPVLGAPEAKIYLHKIHRDCNTFIHGFRMRLNALIALDDFTCANGATEFMAGSHMLESKPTEHEFESSKALFLVNKGDVVLFNSYLWHRAGKNTTTNNRVALTMSFGPGFIKPQLDYARMLGDEYGEHLSDQSRQLLGYNSRVPVNHSEWYRKEDLRLYKSDQG